MKWTMFVVQFVFIVQGYNTFDEALKGLNGLTPAQQQTAQIVAVPSDRNEGKIFFGKLGGLMGKPYGLVFDKDARE